MASLAMVLMFFSAASPGALDEVVHQERDVLGRIGAEAARWDHVQAVEQVLAEDLVGNGLLQVAVRGPQ